MTNSPSVGSSLFIQDNHKPYTFDEYEHFAVQTARVFEEPNSPMELFNWILGMIGELGEFAEPVKKHIFHGKELNLEDLRNEAGDMLYYLTMICKWLNMSLEEAALRNNEKLSRRYPNGFVEGGGNR